MGHLSNDHFAEFVSLAAFRLSGRPILCELLCSKNEITKIITIQSELKKMQKQSPELFYKKKIFFKILQNSQGNTFGRVSFWVKLQAWSENFKNFFFTELLWATASENGFKIFIFTEKNCFQAFFIDKYYKVQGFFLWSENLLKVMTCT